MCDFSIDDIDYIINHPKLSDEYKFKYVEDIANQEIFLDWFDNELGLGVTLEELGLKLEDLTDFYDLDETDYIHTEEMFVEGDKISFDYDDTLTTKRGFELAKSKIDEGYIVYIISARQYYGGMLKRADELGIPHSRVYATGSNKAKVEKIKSLGITKHYDNNSDVVKELGSLGYQFASTKLIPLYQYRSDFYGASNIGDKTRRWCKTMVTRTNLSLMRKQDIESMNSSNPGFGIGGSDTYSVFNWRGGVHCKHRWVKYYYNADTQNMVKAPDQPIQQDNGDVPYYNPKK